MGIKILIVCSVDYSLINFRGDLIKKLQAEDYDVLCAAPWFRDIIRKELDSLGVQCIEYPLNKSGLNPFKDLRSIYALYKLIKEYKVDVVFPYTIKPVLYSSIAAGLRKVPAFSLITGLGFTFSATSTKAKILQKLSEILYRLAMKYNKLIIFQNEDDRRLFIRKGIIPPDKPTAVVHGSGINLEKYPFTLRKKSASDPVRFIIVTRIMPEKGVALFIKAAKTLKKKFPASEYHIVGYSDIKNSSALSQEVLYKLHDEHIIVYHGAIRNIPEILANTDVFVLPSFYREGVPRSILEALSSGMPVITTDTPGCRETVIDNSNGFLIPPKKLKPLIRAMSYFLENPAEISRMGKESNTLARNKFDVHKINSQIIQLINT